VVLHEVKRSDRNLADVEAELTEQVKSKTIDGFLVLPSDLLKSGRANFFFRNTGDVFTRKKLQQALSRTVRSERLSEANIDTKIIDDLSQPVEVQTMKVGGPGGEKDSGEGFLVVFFAGFVMYLTILLYGQVVLGAVIEEKETRIAEILFSSVKPFTLMLGKLVGVSLVALTQLAIWGIAFGIFAIYGATVLASNGVPVSIPSIPIVNYLYFALFFLMGYFVYSTLYALIGSMVTTAQEGGQLAMPIVFLLVIGFYFFFPVGQSPDSSFAFWVSMIPFFAPVTMMVRISTQSPPFWQIALSLFIGFGTVALLTWVASRIYRVGMLMYGKKATIPEVIRWVRQT
jgi:ABC-2 type transport system permease protein